MPVTNIKSKAVVKREGNRVWIEGVHVLSFANGSNSVMQAKAEALRVIGDEVSYDYLMGASGAAFRLQLHLDGWCPSSPHACCGFNCAGLADEVAGYEVAPVMHKADDSASVDRTRQAIIASVDAGVPVLYGSEEEGLIVGYTDGGKEFLVRHPFHARDPKAKDDGYKPMGKWPWGMGILRKAAAAPDRKAVARRSLQRAIDLSKMGKAENYDVGLAVYDRWAKELGDPKFDKMEKKDLDGAMLGNAWVYENLVDARGSAARYLRAIAREFDAPAAAHLTKAGDLYVKEAATLSQNGKCLLDIAPYAWSLKQGQKWTAQQRQTQAELLKAAKKLDEQALAEIAAAIR